MNDSEAKGIGILIGDLEKDLQALVRRMSIPVAGIRPALLNDETAQAVDELRAFRHVFRNVYQNPLKPKKVLELDETVVATVEAFTADCEAFIVVLRTMISEY